MSLEALVEEIQARTSVELARIEAERVASEARLAAERDARIGRLQDEQSRLTAVEVARTRAQLLAAANVEARKRVYEAREARLQAALRATRELLGKFPEGDSYGAVMRAMAARASERLGKQARVSGRAEDAALLSKIAGKAFDPTPRPILGGLVAETPDGSRRLDLSFDELLRLREPSVRELLA